MTGLILTGVPRIPVRANWGRWIVDCRDCPSALWVMPRRPFMRCEDCGAPAELVWPTEEMVHGVERLLLMRPNVATRNWAPGETLYELLVENALHGIGPVTPESGTGPVLGVTEDSIRLDLLPITVHELKAVSA